MRVLVTGSGGFVGKNLVVRLAELQGFEALSFDRQDSESLLAERVGEADAVVHLAGVNRPQDPAEFVLGNVDLTARVCDAIAATGRPVPLIIASSVQVELDNPYGRSKQAAERAAEHLATQGGNPVTVFRLPNLFGKWCRPNYNSVVATFCHNIAYGLPIKISDPAAVLRLAYIDDVIDAFLVALRDLRPGLRYGAVRPQYDTTLGELAAQIQAFRACRTTLILDAVGKGLTRALYATYVSYLPIDQFVYSLPSHADSRGTFVEMLKTKDSGQFSFFTAHPGVTRGGHYHHSKTEKFLVINGVARFRFRHVVTGEYHELEVTGDEPRIVETIPGWTHDITNIGNDDLIVMLWANEIFDRERPDTYANQI